MTDTPTYSTKLLELTKLEQDYVELRVATPEGLHWEAGQYVRLGLPTKDVTDEKKVRALSIASLESDGEVLLGTRTRQEPSSFKANLLTLEPGEEVTLLGPLGKFTLPAGDGPLVMFASGVGVTPIRALIKQALQDHPDQEIDLVFVANGFHLYQADFAAWAKDHPNLKLTLVEHAKEAQSALLDLASAKPAADYFVSGSPAVVDATMELLADQGRIAEDKLHRDVLYGY